MTPVTVVEIGKVFQSPVHSRPPAKVRCGGCFIISYLCVRAGFFQPCNGTLGCSGGIARRQKYTSSFGKPSRANSGTPKFLANSALGVWPSQSVMLNVPNSEKYPL